MRHLLATCLVLLAGCGGEEPSGTSERPETPATGAPGTKLVAALGDSISAGAPAWDPDPAVRAQLTPPLDRRSQYEYWAQRDLAGTRFRNCGVSGELTAEIARRLAGCASGAQVLIVQGGLNDLGQGLAPPVIAANLRAMVRRGRALGLGVALAELLPWNGGGAAGEAAIDDLNERIARIARDEGARLLRWHRLLEDPRAPGSMPARYTPDGVHPSVAGYRRLGSALELP